jgi:hypothetical protein
MFKRYLYIVCFIFLAGFLLLFCAGEKEESDAVGSSDHADLVSLFREFRKFQQPSLTEGVPDYSATAMEKQYRELKSFQNRLAAIDSSGWTVSEQIDYHLVRAEMNGLEFRHRVLKPWLLDPGFYNDVISRTGRVRDFPLDENATAALQEKLRSVPTIVAQAKVNLNDLSDVQRPIGCCR